MLIASKSTDKIVIIIKMIIINFIMSMESRLMISFVEVQVCCAGQGEVEAGNRISFLIPCRI